jgi:nucleoside-diphosphate-sugar epimerase
VGRKCLVTGGTGLLGLNLVRGLAAEGWDVSVLSRSDANRHYLSDLPITYFQGDVGEAEGLDRATAGQEVVFHTAGDTGFWKRNYARQRRTNVDGTVNIIQSARRSGVRRVVHTSTVDAIGFNPDGLADETWGEFNLGHFGYNYAVTKREAEQRALALNGDGIEVVVIQPASMIGPYDVTLQYGRLFVELRDGKAAAAPGGGACFNHVEAVAEAHIAAADRGIPGESYICAGEPVTYRRLFDTIAAKMGTRAPRLTAPAWLLIAYGWADEAIAGLTGKPPQINPGMAYYMSRHAYYSSDKAVASLGYRIVPFEQAIDDAHGFLAARGFLG